MSRPAVGWRVDDPENALEALERLVEQQRAAHPEMSKAQVFAKVYACAGSSFSNSTAGRVSYRLTPWAPNNQNAEVSHNTIRMANSTPPAMGSAQPG
jgi:hypothetical protein